jgi:amidophosphoribosyltransferase
VRDIEPGEMVIIDSSGCAACARSRERAQSCIFEYVYFARPDSLIDGVSVYEARKNLGRKLAADHGVEADVVIPVPGFGRPRHHRLRRGVQVPFELGLVRSHYVGRTFIEPQQSIRHFGVRLKLNP